MLNQQLMNKKKEEKVSIHMCVIAKLMLCYRQIIIVPLCCLC